MKQKNRLPTGINPRLVRPAGWSPKLNINISEMPSEEREIYIVSHLFTFVATGQLAEIYYSFYTNKEAIHLSALSQVWTPWTPPRMPVELEQDLIPFITDGKISELCHLLLDQAKILDGLNEQLGHALAKFLHLPLPENDDDFQKLRQGVDEYRQKNGPVWAKQSEIQSLIGKLQDTVLVLKSLGIQIQVLVTPMLKQMTPNAQEMGDQRAKDLVDEAIGESDPKLAIRLLKQALRYGHTGIQASKAYLELGGRYLDEENITEAIKYYTKSIKAYKHPIPMAFYWRGELYYQQQQWDKAQKDFEQSLALGIYSPEDEIAQDYLSKLQGRKSGQ